MSKHSELLIDIHNLDEDSFDKLLQRIPRDIADAIYAELHREWRRAYLHGYWDGDTGAECELPEDYATYEGPANE